MYTLILLACLFSQFMWMNEAASCGYENLNADVTDKTMAVTFAESEVANCYYYILADKGNKVQITLTTLPTTVTDGHVLVEGVEDSSPGMKYVLAPQGATVTTASRSAGVTMTGNFGNQSTVAFTYKAVNKGSSAYVGNILIVLTLISVMCGIQSR
ncbi:unnamed protein product [Calicophoron daubneyi]|uniref:CUB domain-containing protein n=1 Tax=Calicophoron daubneyi TaxID=300641 RepID=A0AAV2T3N5_CALDB